MARKRAAERDIDIPAVVNPRRKAQCKNDLVKFAKTYFSKPPDFRRFPGRRGLAYRPLSPLHVTILNEFEHIILYGGQQALAAPRGFGKDTLAIIATIWAIVYGHTRFVVFACYEAKSAAKRIESIRNQFETNQWLFEDFPEICAPGRALMRAVQRGKQQTYRGEFTRIEWGETLVMPTIEGSASSGAIISPGSLNGSIRGMNINGERPSFVVISDPQTREVAKSEMQKRDILDSIREDFGGLGAMDDPLAMLVLVTVMMRGDVADQLTNQAEFPQFTGRRFGAIIRWPANMDLWDQYSLLRDEGARTGDKDGRKAFRFYKANRKAMDEGAEVADQHGFSKRKSRDGSPLELSALQHLMNKRWEMGVDSFNSEYQNEPPAADSVYSFSPETVASRLSECPVMVLPVGCTRLVEAIDIRGREIHFVVMAAKPDASQFAVIDYGIRRVHAPEGNLTDQSDQGVQGALQMALLDALRRRRMETTGGATPYMSEDGRPVEIELHLVDSGWMTEIVYQFVRESGPRWRAVKGDQNKKGNRRYVAPQRLSGDTQSDSPNEWFAKKQPVGLWLFHLNVDHWKLFTHFRFSQDRGTFGEIGLFGHDPRQHVTFARHICAEEWDVADGKFIDKSRYNHYLDCVAYCFAGLDMLKVRMVPRGTAAQQARVQQVEPKRFTTPDGRPYLITER